MTFSFSKMFWKGVKYFVVFALPALVNAFIVSYPEWAQLTLGGLLVMFVNWLKIAKAVKLP